MDVPDLQAEADQAFWAERSAIREFMGNQDRQSAEWGAAEDLERWKVREAQAALDAEPGWRARVKP
jgi:hypothetical protein